MTRKERERGLTLVLRVGSSKIFDIANDLMMLGDTYGQNIGDERDGYEHKCRTEDLKVLHTRCLTLRGGLQMGIDY